MIEGITLQDKSQISEMTARALLEVQAVHFRDDKPFIFTSGWASPVYIDCRKLISYPRLRRSLMGFAASTGRHASSNTSRKFGRSPQRTLCF